MTIKIITAKMTRTVDIVSQYSFNIFKILLLHKNNTCKNTTVRIKNNYYIIQMNNYN